MPLKIVLIIFITEIVILIGLGVFLQMNIVGIHNGIQSGEITDLEHVTESIAILSKNVDIILIISCLLFVAIAICLSIKQILKKQK